VLTDEQIWELTGWTLEETAYIGSIACDENERLELYTMTQAKKYIQAAREDSFREVGEWLETRDKTQSPSDYWLIPLIKMDDIKLLKSGHAPWEE